MNHELCRRCTWHEPEGGTFASTACAPATSYHRRHRGQGRTGRRCLAPSPGPRVYHSFGQQHVEHWRRWGSCSNRHKGTSRELNMARRIRLDLMASGGTQTGNGAVFEWPGGDGLFVVEAKSGAGAIGLQIQGPGGVWCNVTQLSTTTDIGITAAAKTANFRAPNGPMRATAGAETGVVCSAIGIPGNVAG